VADDGALLLRCSRMAGNCCAVRCPLSMDSFIPSTAEAAAAGAAGAARQPNGLEIGERIPRGQPWAQP